MRIITGMVYFDSGVTDGIPAERRADLAREFIENYAADELVIPCVQPHAVYTVSPENLREAAAIAQENGVLFSTHASETGTEVKNCIERYGLTPIRHLDRLGALGPHTVLAHCVHLQEDEFNLLAERGVTVAHCPMSNLKLASGIADAGRMLQAGVKVTLGTDGPVSGNDLNLWATMRLAAILQKTVRNDPGAASTQQIVRRVTCDAARALGIGDRAGSLEAGKLADVILVRDGRAHSTPSYDPYATLVYSIGREDVDTVLIDGRVVLRHGTITTLDEGGVIDTVSGLGREIAEFADHPE